MEEDIGLQEFRDYMKNMAAEDKKIKSVTVTADSIEEGLKQASIELEVAVKRLEYEILKKGFSGILGYGKKPFKLLVYFSEPKTPEFAGNDLDVDGFAEDSADLGNDGYVSVNLIRGEVFLKVYPPSKNGKEASYEDAAAALEERGIREFNKKLVKTVVDGKAGIPVKVGSFYHIPANNSTISVNVRADNMKADIIISPPGANGGDLTKDAVLSVLKSNQVVYGVKEEELIKFLDNPQYLVRFTVAEGIAPKDGKDAEIKCNFNTDIKENFFREVNGKIDFRNRDFIQNVVEGQVLAEKIPATKGTYGRLVNGTLLPAKDGNDVPIVCGENVKLSDDGLKAVATCTGQVMMIDGKITVENVYVVPGDVDLSVGNIHFLGTVIVKGNVEDGFSIKATGNIEVFGNVGKSALDAIGNIIVHQGINCSGSGTIKAGKAVVAKFIQNSNIEAGGIVLVSGGIINSYVDSNLKIICKGEMATIVGGRVRATEEISAKTLGSMMVGSTELEVGYDPKSKARLKELEELRTSYEKESEDIERDIFTLENIKKKMRDKFPAEKNEMLDKMHDRSEELVAEIKKCETETYEIMEHLNYIKSTGKISASGTVFPGVKLTIKDAALNIRNENKHLTYINEDAAIKAIPYEAPPDEEV